VSVELAALAPKDGATWFSFLGKLVSSLGR